MPGRVTGQSGFARSFRDGDEANWTRGAYAFGSGAGARSRSRSRILARTRTDCRIQVSVLRHAGTVKGQRGISGSPGFSVGGGYRPVAKSNALFFNRSLSLAQPPKGSIAVPQRFRYSIPGILAVMPPRLFLDSIRLTRVRCYGFRCSGHVPRQSVVAFFAALKLRSSTAPVRRLPSSWKSVSYLIRGGSAKR